MFRRKSVGLRRCSIDRGRRDEGGWCGSFLLERVKKVSQNLKIETAVELMKVRLIVAIDFSLMLIPEVCSHDRPGLSDSSMDKI